MNNEPQENRPEEKSEEDVVTERRAHARELYLQYHPEERPKTLNLVTDAQLAGVDVSRQSWFIPNYIPEKAVVMWAGKRSSCKTWSALHLAISLATGKPFFGEFESKPTPVLYIDEENGLPVLKERVEQIKAGMGVIEFVDNLFYTSFEGIKLDMDVWLEPIRNFLKEHNPAVIIIDSLRRVIRAEENDAGEMNTIFTEYIRPMVEEHNCTWIFQHHLRKGISGRKPEDDMDELRGSSELTNYADVVLIFQKIPKNQDKFLFKQAKCRRAREQPTYMIEMQWADDDKSVKFANLGTAEQFLDQVDLAMRKIMVWLEENNKIEFRTPEVIKSLKEQKLSERTTQRALSDLVDSGKLLKPERGHYMRPPPERQTVFGGNDDMTDGEDKNTVQPAKKATANDANLYSIGAGGGDAINHKSQVIQLLVDSKDGVSRPELAVKLGVPESEVKPLVERMLSDGVIYEPNGPGRLRLVK
jgi:hypothetical protein